jgi:hypothetical protein
LPVAEGHSLKTEQRTTNPRPAGWEKYIYNQVGELENE